ncbi:MAG: V-type ATP synthase subunit D [Nocardioides sp.]
MTRARDEWRAQAAEAAQLLTRARALGATDELRRLAALEPAARIEPDWQASMGITYPGEVRCLPGPTPPLTSTAALVPATEAHRAALTAAATAGAAELAVERLDAELGQTRRRRRAVEDRLVPDLLDQRRRLELRLDELDREEALRVRVAARLAPQRTGHAASARRSR